MFTMFFADASQPSGKPPRDDKADASAAGDKPAVVEEELLEEEGDLSEEVAHTMTLLLPWAISLLAHLGLGLLAFFVVWSVAFAEDDEEEIVPTAKLVNDNPTEMLTFSQDLEVPATTDIPREIQTQEVAKGDPLSALNQEVATDQALIGVTGSNALPVGSRIGQDAFGVGMYGVGGNARTIVYVVDASGSLVDTLAFVIDELRTSIRKLSPEQRFTVIFFQRDTAIEVPVPHRGLKKATDETKRAVSDYIDLTAGNIVPGGSSNPKRALEEALRLRPDLMFVLSDNITGKGQYAIDQEELLDLIEKAKGSRNADTMINTIQFLYPDPLGTLKKIADAHGGRYKFVDASIVGLER